MTTTYRAWVHTLLDDAERGSTGHRVVTAVLVIEVEPTPIRLGKGHFFGEIALLRETVRTATITTVAECHLLTLEVADFRRLLATHPGLRATITRVAEERLAARPGAGTSFSDVPHTPPEEA